MTSPLRKLASRVAQQLEGRLIEGSFGSEGWAQTGGETPIVDHRLLATLLARRNRKFLESIHTAQAQSENLLELRAAGVHASSRYLDYLKETLVVLIQGKPAREVEVEAQGNETVVRLRYRSKLVKDGATATCSLFPENRVLTISSLEETS